MLPLFDLPFVKRAENRLLAVSYVGFGEGLIAPVNRNLLCAQLVALVYNHLDEFGLVELGHNDDLLTLLYVYATASDEICIFFESCLVHFRYLFIFVLRNHR